MSNKWNGNIISKDARYRTQSVNQSRGIYTLDEQLQHKAANNWFKAKSLADNVGYHFDTLTIKETTVAADDTDAFSVVTAPMPSSASQGRVYLAVGVTAATTFYNDFCVGTVQIPHDNGASLNSTLDTSTNVSWVMSNPLTTYGYGSWQRGSAVTSGNTTLSSVSGYTWTNITTGTGNNKWNAATSTGSSRTGAQGGINNSPSFNIFNELGDLVVGGNSANRMAQTNANFYIYTETSGTAANSVIWCRSPEVTLTGSNHILVIAYHACTSSGGIGMVNTTDKPLLKAFWDES